MTRSDSRKEAPGPAPSSVSPDAVRSFRTQLTRGENVIDPATFAGSIPQLHGIAPRVRIGHGKWFNLLWLLPIGFVLLIVAVAIAQGLSGEPAIERFIQQYPGTIEPVGNDAEITGFPAWVSWQHFFNLFFMVFIIRWWRCHRRLLCDYLMLVHGFGIRHVMHDASLREHRLTEGVRRLGDQVVYDQLPVTGESAIVPTLDFQDPKAS